MNKHALPHWVSPLFLVQLSRSFRKETLKKTAESAYEQQLQLAGIIHTLAQTFRGSPLWKNHTHSSPNPLSPRGAIEIWARETRAEKCIYLKSHGELRFEKYHPLRSKLEMIVVGHELSIDSSASSGESQERGGSILREEKGEKWKITRLGEKSFWRVFCWYVNLHV